MRLGRILGGVGAAAASMASKYIDEELAQQRAQAMADLQVKTASRMREDQAAFDDKRAPTLRQRAADDARAAATTQDEIELSRLTNNPLITARRTVQEGDAASALASELARRAALDPLDITKQGQLSEAAARAAAKFRPASQADMTPEQRLAAMEKALGRTLTNQEREQIVLGAKPFDDSVQVVESVDPLTGEKTTKRTWRERPGQGGQASAGTDTQALIDYAIKNGKVPQLVAKMEADGMSPGDIMRAVGEDQYAKAKGADKRNARATEDGLEGKSDMQLQRIAQLRLSGAPHPEALRAQRILSQRAADRQKSTGPDPLAVDISRYLASRN